MQILIIGGSSSVSLSQAKYLTLNGHEVQFHPAEQEPSHFRAPVRIPPLFGSFEELLRSHNDVVQISGVEGIKAILGFSDSPQDLAEALSVLRESCGALVYYAYGPLPQHPLLKSPQAISLFHHLFLGSPLQSIFGKYSENHSWLPVSLDHEYIVARPECDFKRAVRIVQFIEPSHAVNRQIVHHSFQRLEKRGLRYEFHEKNLAEIKDVKQLRDILKAHDLLIQQLEEKDFGLLDVEALSHGCTVLSAYPQQLAELWHPLKLSPILHTTLQGFEGKLELVLREPRCLRDLAKRSRQFAHSYHNAETAMKSQLEKLNEILSGSSTETRRPVEGRPAQRA